MSKTDTNNSVYILSLSDNDLSEIDNTGKSMAYFALKHHVAIDKNIIKELKFLSQKLGNIDIRICLHNERKSNHHNMINLIYKKETLAPHKHLHKSESYHIIEGKLRIIIYDDNGKIIDECLLDNKSTFIYQVGKDTFHTTTSDTEHAIFHETRPGPFEKGGDSIFLMESNK